MKTSHLLAAACAATFAGAATAATYTSPIGVTTTVGVDDSGDVFTDTFAAGAVASIDSITIEIAHSWSGDVDIILTAPDGGLVEVTDVAGSQDFGDGAGYLAANALTYTFIESGGADPSAVGTPIPAGTYTDLSSPVWDDDSVGGVWSVLVTDDAGGDAGYYGSITVEYTLVPEPGSIALLGLGGLAMLRRRR